MGRAVRVCFREITNLLERTQQRDKEHALGAKNSVTSPTSTLIQGEYNYKKGMGGKRGEGRGIEVCPS